jgi:putative flippase GtrA
MFGSKGVRFIIVGVGAALLLFALNWLFVAFDAPPFVSGIVAYAIAFVCAYSAHHGWTFGGAHAHSQSFPRYLAVQAFCALLSGLISHVSVAVFDASPAIMSAAATVIGSTTSYLLVRYWAFADSRAVR